MRRLATEAPWLLQLINNTGVFVEDNWTPAHQAAIDSGNPPHSVAAADCTMKLARLLIVLSGLDQGAST